MFVYYDSTYTEQMFVKTEVMIASSSIPGIPVVFRDFQELSEINRSFRTGSGGGKTMKGKRTMQKLHTEETRSFAGEGRKRAEQSVKISRSITRFILSVMAAAALVCIILFSSRSITSADETGEAVKLTKYYKTITIETGDSLWSIADQYRSGEYRTTKDYVEELRLMNGLHSDRIQAGQKLVVAYFAE